MRLATFRGIGGDAMGKCHCGVDIPDNRTKCVVCAGIAMYDKRKAKAKIKAKAKAEQAKIKADPIVRMVTATLLEDIRGCIGTRFPDEPEKAAAVVRMVMYHLCEDLPTADEGEDIAPSLDVKGKDKRVGSIYIVKPAGSAGYSDEEE